MTNEIISQKLDCTWHHLRQLLEAMNLAVDVDQWPVEPSDTKEPESDAEDL